MKTDELLFLETDGSCAFCGHKDTRALTIHHLDGAKPKNEAYDNKVLLCHNCHQSHHLSKGATTAELKTIKRRLIIKSLTSHGLNALKYALRREAVVAAPFLVNHLVEFGYLSHVQDTTIWSDDVDGSTAVLAAIYRITDDGKKLLLKWDLK